MDPRTLIWCVVGVSALLGLTPFNHYGEGWDEQVDFAYGRDAADHFRASASYWDDYGNLKYYGPAYLMLAHSVAIHLKPLIPGWHISDARHFVNHLTFQVATLALFYLCLRYVSGWSALVAALLFHTQPLLFGHSFINQKDVPFLASFLLSVWLGFKLADLKPRHEPEPASALRQDWARTPRGQKLALITTGALTMLAWLELIAVRALILPSLLRIISEAYAGESLPVVNDWFLRTAEHAGRVPVEAYQLKATTLYFWFRWPLSAVTAAPFILLAARTFRSTLSSWWSSRSGPLTLALLAGAAAGLTTATRVVGFSLIPLVGSVVAIRRRWAAFPILAVYSAGAAATCFGVWPYLRSAPLEHLWETIRVMSRFPWGSGIVYMGDILTPAALPWHYVPVLLAIQLTLPALVLAAAGIGLGASQAFRNKDLLPEFLCLLTWAAGPVVAAEVLNSTLYNNFRQLLFITPRSSCSRVSRLRP